MDTFILPIGRITLFLIEYKRQIATKTTQPTAIFKPISCSVPPELRNLKSPEKNPNKPYQNTNKPQPKHHQNQNEQIEKYKLKKTYM